MKRVILRVFTVCVSIAVTGYAQEDVPDSLTVERIMRDRRWIGVSPGRVRWSPDSETVLFEWNPENAPEDSLYSVHWRGASPKKVTKAERETRPSSGRYTRDGKRMVYEKEGDIYLLDVKSGEIRALTKTLDREYAPRFTHDEKKVTFMSGSNLFMWGLGSGGLVQMTDFRKGREPEKVKEPSTDQGKWLAEEERKMIQVLARRREKRLQREKSQEEKNRRPGTLYLGEKQVRFARLSPDETSICFSLQERPGSRKSTIVPNYVTETGYTETIRARTKVGGAMSRYSLGIYSIPEDTIRYFSATELPGIYDRPAFLEEKGKVSEDSVARDEKKPPPREVFFSEPVWSFDGERAVLAVTSLDNKDRWIAVLDVDSCKLITVDRYRDEAWLGGPGIRSWWGGSMGWLHDNRRVWFQSEETGYSHLYTVDVVTGEKRALTSGAYEVSGVRLSRDGKTWYFTSNRTHPGERHFYRMPAEGGRPEQITSGEGCFRVRMSPDEKKLAVLHSVSNRPWELYIMENRRGAGMRRITRSLSSEFLSYNWRKPEIVTITARDSVPVYARLFRSGRPVPGGPAVMFIHGAGYLQNAHKWWSSYFREYMFHNLLADQGYTVLDIDYRGSAGYGREWRTGIYRYMGGKDLTDCVDGARWLVDSLNVDPGRIGIYGGSYGGFITLMAMFTQPGVFRAGAALRPVTDWAHYNHGYTSNILNTPVQDSLAYIRSSPLYHAEGLEGALLICHGMVDTNVHFQDVVRLVQRLIELGKENWELAVYPVEGHGFREPESWTDEYRRIYRLFETYLKGR
jgi:dipeptidyl aminopeptidase/acylaminoacyl peptidase